MIIRPVNGSRSAASEGVIPAWQAIQTRQTRACESYYLIAQPDHAALSGQLAAQFASPIVPELSEEAVRAIGMHDCGWGIFPAETTPSASPMLTESGKPRSFIEFQPHDFTRAWTASIERASTVGPLAGMLVSRHFTWLGEQSLRMGMHSSDESAFVREFLVRESERQRRLSAACDAAPAYIEDVLRVLQLCDLLSLALCCGVEEEVEFPQRFGGKPLRMRFDQGVHELTPSPFKQADAEREVALEVNARLFPTNADHDVTKLQFVLR